MERALAAVVYFDFASTLCYVAHRVMERIAGDLEDVGVELHWRPVDLARLAGWRRGEPIAGARRTNALRVAADLGVPVRMPAVWPDSRAAGAVALALAQSELAAPWRERVFSAIHEQGHSLDDAAALATMARDLGLDLEHLLTADALASLDAETERAREHEVSGVPTFLLGGWPIGGIQEDWVMRSMLTRWARRRRPSAASDDA